jgi:hypothetical protein
VNHGNMYNIPKEIYPYFSIKFFIIIIYNYKKLEIFTKLYNYKNVLQILIKYKVFFLFIRIQQHKSLPNYNFFSSI